MAGSRCQAGGIQVRRLEYRQEAQDHQPLHHLGWHWTMVGLTSNGSDPTGPRCLLGGVPSPRVWGYLLEVGRALGRYRMGGGGGGLWVGRCIKVAGYGGEQRCVRWEQVDR